MLGLGSIFSSFNDLLMAKDSAKRRDIPDVRKIASRVLKEYEKTFRDLALYDRGAGAPDIV